jgi:hypothetical protein
MHAGEFIQNANDPALADSMSEMPNNCPQLQRAKPTISPVHQLQLQHSHRSPSSNFEHMTAATSERALFWLHAEECGMMNHPS